MFVRLGDAEDDTFSLLQSIQLLGMLQGGFAVILWTFFYCYCIDWTSELRKLLPSVQKLKLEA